MTRDPFVVGTGDDVFRNRGGLDKVDGTWPRFVFENLEVDFSESVMDGVGRFIEFRESLEHGLGLLFHLVGTSADDVLPDLRGIFQTVAFEHFLPGSDLGSFGIENQTIKVEKKCLDQGSRVPSCMQNRPEYGSDAA